MADAASRFTRLGAGCLSDRFGRRKPIVLAGYALTLLGQVLFALAMGIWFVLISSRAADTLTANPALAYALTRGGGGCPTRSEALAVAPRPNG